MRRVVTVPLGVLLAMGFGLGTPSPAAAECGRQTNQFPPFTRVARSADTIVIGTVVEELSGHTGEVATFRIRVDEVLRGGAGETMDILGVKSGLPLKGSPSCRENAFLYARLGDVLAIALDGRLHGREGVNTAAWIEGRPGLTRGAEALTRAAARRASGVARSGVNGAVQVRSRQFRGHPLSGSWIAHLAEEGSAPLLELLSFDEAGVVRAAGPTGVSVGAWAPTGERTANATLVFPIDIGDGARGLGTIRGGLEVAEDGQSFTATYTIEFRPGPALEDGPTFPVGQLGPVTVNAERIVVEPMGEPVGPPPSIEQLTTGNGPGA